MNRLDPIVAAAREEVAHRRRVTPLPELEAAVTRRAAGGDVRSFADALARPGLSLIAEHKRNSPSAGAIRDDLDLEEVVGAYERGGAAALLAVVVPDFFSETVCPYAVGVAAIPT